VRPHAINTLLYAPLRIYTFIGLTRLGGEPLDNVADQIYSFIYLYIICIYICIHIYIYTYV